MQLEHVGLNLLHLVPGETGGVEVYDRCLIAALRQVRPELRLTLFVFREAAASLRREPWADDVSIVRLPGSGRNRMTRVAAEQALLPLAARRASIDLLHNLLTTAPAIPGVPQVTTIHDLIYKRYPETHFGILALGLSVLVPVAARRSRRLIADSEATKNDIVRFLGVAPSRVDVVYPGPGLPPKELVSEAELRQRLDLGDGPIVLTVSAKRPHKNIERLLEAMVQLRTSPRPVLLLPGYATPFEETLQRRALTDGGGAEVRFTDWIDDATLDAAYRAATCLVFPSLAEGFGLPVLEAMARGTPVACSNRTSLPEVAGDAALYFDPLDPAAIAEAIEQLLTDGDLRTRLRQSGLERVLRFSWEATAEATLDCYERALAGPSNRS
jgi:glycosyltransferase involved in cell wall biosynthesis